MFKNNKFNSKNDNTITIVLAVLIIGILAIIAYVIYDVVMIKVKNDNATEIVAEFSEKTSKIKKYNINTTGSDSNSNYDELINQVESAQTTEFSASTEKTYMEGYEVMGTISIPKTGIEYPILSEVTTKSLETAVAILDGVGLNQVGNTTILGHNYRNGLFFSDNKKLVVGDIIKITDQTGTTVTYTIYDTYVTTPNDATYMRRDTEGAREISLSTCTDDVSGRLIILAKEK